MTFYWIYSIPGWLFGLLTILVYVAFGVVTLLLTRKWVRRLHYTDHSHNDIVSYYLAALTVFYGITLGLVAVSTWNNYAAITDKLDGEVQVTASIYRDLSVYQEPLRSALKKDLTGYIHDVIYVDWPMQKKGDIPPSLNSSLSDFQSHLMSFNPKDIAGQIIQTEVFQRYNALVEFRRGRLDSIRTNLPASLWSLVIIGGLICLFASVFFDCKSIGMHLWMTVLFATLLGLMIFLIGIMDNPFRGQLKGGDKPMSILYHQLLLKK